MLVASKYWEIHPPVPTDFTFVTDNSYTEKQLLAYEMRLLSIL